MRLVSFQPKFQDAVLRLNALTVTRSEFIGRSVDPAWHDDLLRIPLTYLESGGAFLLGFQEKRLVAMGGLRKLDDATAEVARIRVHPDFQGQGYSAEILGDLEREARARGFRKLVGHSAAGNVPAERMFRHAGYSPVKEKSFHGVPCVVFEKKI